MKLEFISEPELDFGNGKHVDVRFGLANWGVLDYGESAARQIRLGIVGTNETIDGLSKWIRRCENGITSDQIRLAHLFPSFPGFSENHTFYSSIESQSSFQAVLDPQDLKRVLAIPSPADCAMAAVSLFDERLRHLREEEKLDVVICAPPIELANRTLNEGDRDERRSFRDALKAAAMMHQTPTQVVLPPTYDSKKKLKRVTKDSDRSLQDEATRAWNFFTAIYYKAGGVPWRMMRLSSEYSSCFVGISFYRSLDGATLQTSLAQVFNEKGEGVVVRGAAASQTKDDKHPYLERDDAQDLLARALARYRTTHGNIPARVVVHKSSPFQPSETEGFRSALDTERVTFADFISIGSGTARLLREGDYPPLRGTMAQLSERDAILYTKGSVEFYKTYPGMYVPDPVTLTIEQSTSSMTQIATEVLALTKMNWNRTQFDGRNPITIEAARQVGKVLKYVGEGQHMEASYRFYT